MRRIHSSATYVRREQQRISSDIESELEYVRERKAWLALARSIALCEIEDHCFDQFGHLSPWEWLQVEESESCSMPSFVDVVDFEDSFGTDDHVYMGCQNLDNEDEWMSWNPEEPEYLPDDDWRFERQPEPSWPELFGFEGGYVKCATFGKPSNPYTVVDGISWAVPPSPEQSAYVKFVESVHEPA